MDADRKKEAEPTGRIKQNHVLSGVDAAFLSESCGYFLCPLVQLEAGRCAHCDTLKERSNTMRQEYNVTENTTSNIISPVYYSPGIRTYVYIHM